MGFLSKLLKNNSKAQKTEQEYSSKNDNIQIYTETVQVNSSYKNVYNPIIPPLQGDYAKTVFLWAFSKASPIKNQDEYVRYLLYECGIKDPVSYHCSLIKNGYFEESSPQEQLKALKVDKLKLMLKELKQPVSGKKDILIERILNNSDDLFIKKYCPATTYSLSKKGQQFLTEHEDYIKIHKHRSWDIDWQEYDARHKDGYSFYDTVWGILNERIIKDQQNFGRNEYLCMYQLLSEEGKKKNAIEMLLRVLYIDLSGVNILDSIRFYQQGLYTLKDLEDLFSIAIMLAPGIIFPIAEYKDVYDDCIVDRIYEWRLPIQVCDKKLFVWIVHSIINDTYDKGTAENKLRVSYNRVIHNLKK